MLNNLSKLKQLVSYTGILSRNVVTSSSKFGTDLLQESINYKSNEGNFSDLLIDEELMKKEEAQYTESLKHPDYFNVSKYFTVEDLFNNRVHLGHRTGTLNEYMTPFIFGKRLDHFIIDLDQTSTLLKEALNFTAHVAFRKGIILFIGRNPQQQILIERTAIEAREYAHTRSWKEGLFLNSNAISDDAIRLPDLVIFINIHDTVNKLSRAVSEAAKMLIPTIGIVDTNCDPRLISYPIPGNDDSMAAVSIYCRLFKQAILDGREKRKVLGLN